MDQDNNGGGDDNNPLKAATVNLLASFDHIKDIGYGSTGSTQLVRHKKSGRLMARKIICGREPEMIHEIGKAVSLRRECDYDQIVPFYDSYLKDGDVHILMEYMDIGSLDVALEKCGRFPEPYLRHICKQVIGSLMYLGTEEIKPRAALKPSRLFLNSKGQTKMCGLLDASIISDRICSRRFYMSPERLIGHKYTANTDIWSLGLIIMELATGRHPYPPSNMEKDPMPLRTLDDNGGVPEAPEQGPEPMSIFEHLALIVDDDPPMLSTSQGYSDDMLEFVNLCVVKDPEKRPGFQELAEHPWLLADTVTNDEFAAWIATWFDA